MKGEVKLRPDRPAAASGILAGWGSVTQVMSTDAARALLVQAVEADGHLRSPTCSGSGYRDDEQR